jgi:hypothetical protein
MRIHLKWFITGKVTPLEERDELLGPATTVLEVKGLIQLKYTYPAKHMLLIAGKQLLENETTLAEAGIVDQAAADDATHVLTVHVLSGADLEDDDDDDEVAANTKTGSSIHEFTHEDFIKASKMLGRELPVSRARAAEVRAAAPRARPSFLDAKPAVAEDPPVFQDTTAASGSAPIIPNRAGRPSAANIFRNVLYGLRKEGLEKLFAVRYPGAAEEFDFWDLRLSHDPRAPAAPGQLAMELYYFGEIEKVDSGRLQALAVDALSQHGFRVAPFGAIREAGCMYPLIAVPVVMSEDEAYRLGDAVFERFGIPLSEAPAPPQRTAPAQGPAGSGEKGDCVVM